MQKIFITFFILLFVLFLGKTFIENFFPGGASPTGCSGLDERECLQYPQCLWHIDRSRTDTEGQCMSRRDLPQFIKQDLRWDQMMDRYLNRYNPYYYLQKLYYGQTIPSYYYTTRDNSPWSRYNLTRYTLV